jgi:Arc/MetJ family transcription regulator
MRTTLEIDAKLLDEAMQASGAPNKTTAVRLGLEALVAKAARQRLAALHGKIPAASCAPRRRQASRAATVP